MTVNKLVMKGVLFSLFLFYLFFIYSELSNSFFFKPTKKLLTDSKQTSKSQLTPIAALIHAAGAKTSKSRIITEAKYTLKTA